MVAAHYSRSFYAVSGLIASIFGGCRVPQRDIPAEGNSGTLKVQLNNFDTGDAKNASAFIYNLNTCLPEVSGILQPKDTVDFTAPGMTNGLKGCKLQIKTAQPLPDRQFAQGADPLVLYSADLSDVFINLDGELAAKAPLKKLYSSATSGAQQQQQQPPLQPTPQQPVPPASPPVQNDTGTPQTSSSRLWLGKFLEIF